MKSLKHVPLARYTKSYFSEIELREINKKIYGCLCLYVMCQMFEYGTQERLQAVTSNSSLHKWC